MKWNVKPKKPIPIEGDTKEKIRFAFFPTKVEDKWLWLEKYVSIYQYKKYFYRYDVVVSEGLFTEKFYTTLRPALGWERINRRFI